MQADRNNYSAGSSVKFIDNFAPCLFSRIKGRKHNTILDEIDYPGIWKSLEFKRQILR